MSTSAGFDGRCRKGRSQQPGCPEAAGLLDFLGTIRRLASAVACVLLLGLVCGANVEPGQDRQKESPPNSRRAIQQALEPFNDWVGSWRGVGQPRRNSSKGAWREDADWAWKIDRDSAGLEVAAKDAKLIAGGRLTYDQTQKQFLFIAKSPEDTTRTYAGQRGADGKLTLVNVDDKTKDEHRLTFHMIHADRLLLLVEVKPAGRSEFSRVAEVGYTRKGGSFAAAADAGPKCIVTGGRGTTKVEYKGKTYYVCCSGCKQAFEDDPEGILAEAAERAKLDASRRRDEK